MNLLNTLIKPFVYLFKDDNSWDRTYENNLNIQSINISKPKTPAPENNMVCSGVLISNDNFISGYRFVTGEIDNRK